MTTDGARTPEDVDPLLEDALVLPDRAAFEALFTDGAALAVPGAADAHGHP